MIIREAVDLDRDRVLSVNQAAFGSDEEANLVAELLDDPSAQPVVSLLALQEKRVVGHILFTKACLEPQVPISISILAPLAVMPKAQHQGIGTALVNFGFKALTASGLGLVFVLGYPKYYRRFGFEPAGNLGFDAPYPIPEKNADAWMVKALRPDIIGTYVGKVICAHKLNRAKYWHE